MQRTMMFYKIRDHEVHNAWQLMHRRSKGPAGIRILRLKHAHAV